MKLYKLTVNEKGATPQIITSSFKAERYPRQVLYYLNKEKAEARRDEIYDGITALAGFFPNVEVTISEIEVIE